MEDRCERVLDFLGHEAEPRSVIDGIDFGEDIRSRIPLRQLGSLGDAFAHVRIDLHRNPEPTVMPLLDVEDKRLSVSHAPDEGNIRKKETALLLLDDEHERLCVVSVRGQPLKYLNFEENKMARLQIFAYRLKIGLRKAW